MRRSRPIPPEDAPEDALEDGAPPDLRPVRSLMNAMVELAYGDGPDLTIRMIAVLVLAGEGTYSVREVHQRLRIPKPSISRCCTALEQLRFLRRSRTKTDGRLTILRQTPAGTRFLAQLFTPKETAA